jgi:GAF domain-containing protein
MESRLLAQARDLLDILAKLNETGQFLTEDLDPEQTLQGAVERIQAETRADVVILYPYDNTERCFVHPPRVSGTLLDSDPRQMYPARPRDVVRLLLERVQPIFARQSASLYSKLRGEEALDERLFALREHISSTAAVPLRVKNEPVGVLFVNFRQPQRFEESRRLFIEGLAHYAAIAIKNAYMYDRLGERRQHELEILRTIDHELNSSLELVPVLHTILRLGMEQIPADAASILLYDRRRQILTIPAAVGLHATEKGEIAISLLENKGISHWVLDKQKPARVDNVHSEAHWRDIYIQTAPETISELDVPLLNGEEECIGVLNFESAREAAFSEQDEAFLITLAGQAVLAIKNAQAYEREKRLVAEGKVLNDISREITSQLDVGKIFDLILEKALTLTHSTSGTLRIYDLAAQQLRIKAERGADKEKKASRLNLDQGIVGYVAKHKQLQNVGDVTQKPWSGIFQDAIPGTRSELAVPMMAGNILRGVLNVESPTPNQFDESDERLLEGLADLAVVALQNAERYELVGKERQRFRLWYQARQELDDITDLAQLDKAYDLIARIAAEHSQSHAIIRRFDADTEELVMVYSSQPDYIPLYTRINLNTGIGGQVARERRTIVIDDIHHLPSGVAIPQLSDTTARALLITPITLNERYYGNLVLIHPEGSHFQKADREFFEGLAQELAATIYRLEITQERQEYAEKFRANEIMSSLGQVTFELTHQLGNDLGLVESYVDDVRQALTEQNAAEPVIMRKLDTIVRMTRKVLDLSKQLKQELPRQTEQVTVPAAILLEEALSQLSSPLPPDIQHELIVDGTIGNVRINYSSVADILHNLMINAIEAMPGGGKLTLRAYNEGRYIALDVTDSGVGIPENLLSKIFGLSFSTKGSSGFGLWSARKNALDNYGDLKVKSCVNQGTTFTLLLPRVEKKIEELV